MAATGDLSALRGRNEALIELVSPPPMPASTHASPGRAAVVFTIVAIVALSAAACGKKDDNPSKHNRTYKTRGVVESLPGTTGSMFIRHEAIPDFVTSAGKKMNMQSMSMGFFVGSVPVSGIAKDDKVSFEFRTDWSLKPALRLVSITKLPADTVLTF